MIDRLRRGLRALFGELRWQAPPWMTALAELRRQQPSRFRALVAGLVGVPLVVVAGWLAWSLLPEPVLTRVAIAPPEVTPIGPDGELYPQPLTLTFTTEYPDARDRGPRDAARLDLVGQTLAEGVALSPQHDGSWRWLDGRTLRFEPAADWPAGQTYRVRVESAVLAEGITLADRAPAFSTPPLVPNLDSLEFYTNPEDSGERRVVGTLSFNHGIDRDSLLEHLSLTMRPGDAPVDQAETSYQFTVELGPHGRSAHVTSEVLDLPARESFMALTLSPGLAAARGPSTSEDEIRQDVPVPSRDTYFRVNSIETRIVRNEDNDPEQTLVVDLTDGVALADLEAQLEVWLMPDVQWAWGRRQIPDELMARAERLELESNPEPHQDAALQTFRLRAPPGRKLLVRLPSGLVSRGEYVLAVPYSQFLDVPRYPPEVRIVGDGAVLAMTGERTLSLQARAVPALRVQLFRLPDDQLTHLITQTAGDLGAASFQFRHRFDEENLGERLERILLLSADDPAEAVYASLDLEPFLDEAGRGVFVARVEAWNPETERALPRVSDRRLILVTDLSLIAKDHADGSHALYVHSLADQGPVAGASIELLGRNGRPVMERRSDATGFAEFPDVRDLSGAQQPAAYLVRRGGDLSFLPFDRHDRRLQLSRFDIGGVRTAGRDADNRLQAQVFTDRGIYRPGESGHLGVMVKRFDWGSVADVPVEVIVTDPRGSTLLDERLALPADGFVELPLEFATTAATGPHNARVYLVNDGRRSLQLGVVGFSVEEFQPDTMRIRTRIVGGERPGWRTLANYTGEVRLENLFGLPAQGRRVQASYTLAPIRFRFPEFDGFVFDDPFRDREQRLEQSVSQSLPEQTSDTSGEARFELDLSQYGPGLFRLSLASQGYEPDGGRSVSAVSAVQVSAAEQLVGWKADGDLGYVRRDAERQVRFVVVNPTLEAVAAALTLRVVEKRSLSTLVRQDNGTLAYQTVVRRETVSEEPFAVAAGGSDWTLPAGAAGEFVAELVDEQQQVVARVDYSIVGEGNLAGGVDTEAELDLKLDRSSYAPGEEIELQITAPYAGSGLITIERDRVYAHRWFATAASSSVQRIRVPAELEGNAYVNVAFVRALDADEIFTRPLSYAVAPFDIGRERRTVGVELDVPERVVPGERLDITLSTDRPARVVVFAVDEGILQVAGYQTPRPLETFMQKRALEVATLQMADLLMPEFSLLEQRLAPGGGAARAMLGANLNPFQRALEAPVVFWSGIVETGGEALTLPFTVPDRFDGQLRVMAVASAAEAAGAAEASTLVRGPFVLQPNVIVSAAPGDEFEVGVGVTNALETPGPREIVVRLEGDQALEVTSADAQTLSLDAGEEGRARFTVRAGARPGAGALVFHAESGEQRVRRTSTLSVRPAVPHRTTLNAGISRGGSGTTTLERRLLPELATQSASLGYSPLILAGGLDQYLQGFPHGCSEQIVSRVFPALALGGELATGRDEATLQAAFRDTVASLRARQLGDGGFTVWPGSNVTDDFITIYVMHFLTEAAELGVAVPLDMRRTGLDRLRQIAAAEPAVGQAAYLQAYAIYLLTRNGVVTTNYATRLEAFLGRQDDAAWRSELPAVYLAATFEMLKIEDRAGNLLAGYRYAEPGSDYASDLDSALARNAQYVYLLGRHFPAALRGIDDAAVTNIVGPISDGRYNTLSAAYAMLALSAWGRGAAERADAPLRIVASRADGGEARRVEGPPPLLRTDLDVDVTTVQFAGAADERLFHTASQAGFDAELPQRAVSRGLEVVREFLNADGEAVTSAAQGAELTVRLKVRALDNRLHPNVALVDLLPGGFEVERDSVRRESGGWRTDYVDIREDRVVAYGTVSPAAQVFEYRVRTTGAGNFVVPPAFATSMYHPDQQAQSPAGRFTVEPR